MQSGNRKAHFDVGMVIRHRLFGYRGVIYDIDFEYNGSEQWYLTMARSRPPKNAPWYHVLVHGGEHRTYVAERNLAPEEDPIEIAHPALADYFTVFEGGRYRSRQVAN